jgi:hypothetical protein
MRYSVTPVSAPMVSTTGAQPASPAMLAVFVSAQPIAPTTASRLANVTVLLLALVLLAVLTLVLSTAPAPAMPLNSKTRTL